MRLLDGLALGYKPDPALTDPEARGKIQVKALRTTLTVGGSSVANTVCLSGALDVDML